MEVWDRFEVSCELSSLGKHNSTNQMHVPSPERRDLKIFFIVMNRVGKFQISTDRELRRSDCIADCSFVCAQ